MIGIRTVILALFNMICVIRCNKSQRQIEVRKVQLGDPVTLYCVLSRDEFSKGTVLWYKQMIGETPQALTRTSKFTDTEIFDEGNKGHFNIEKADADRTYRLSIAETYQTDEAIYYCVVWLHYHGHFKNDTFLILEGKHHHRPDYQTVVQPASEHILPGASVSLQCSVLSETCTGEHSVFWFRAGSHPGLIYTPGNRRGECEKRPETPSPTQSCVYSLSLNNFSSSDAGTYYCAVATCGEILFGNGTKLDVGTECNLPDWLSSVCVYVKLGKLFTLLALYLGLSCYYKTKTRH